MSKQYRKPLPMEGQELIPAPRVSEIIGISTKHMRTLERKGDFIPRVQIGPRKVGYKPSDLEAWIDARTVRLSAGGTT